MIKTKIINDKALTNFNVLKRLIGYEEVIDFIGRYSANIICKNINNISNLCNYIKDNKIDLDGIIYEKYLEMYDEAQKKGSNNDE